MPLARFPASGRCAASGYSTATSMPFAISLTGNAACSGAARRLDAADLWFGAAVHSGTEEFLVGEYVDRRDLGSDGAFIDRVILREGAWDGTAAGYMIVSNVVGTFVAETIGSAARLGLCAADGGADRHPDGGPYDFTNHNFYGAASRSHMYFANGADTAFEWDGIGAGPNPYRHHRWHASRFPRSACMPLVTRSYAANQSTRSSCLRFRFALLHHPFQKPSVSGLHVGHGHQLGARRAAGIFQTTAGAGEIAFGEADHRTADGGVNSAGDIRSEPYRLSHRGRFHRPSCSTRSLTFRGPSPTRFQMLDQPVYSMAAAFTRCRHRQRLATGAWAH